MATSTPSRAVVRRRPRPPQNSGVNFNRRVSFDGLCKCGCGGVTNIAKHTYKSRGWVRGQHVSYLPGHHQLGRRKWPIKIDPVTGCHVWQGALFDSGYAQVKRNGKNKYAHRESYEKVHGPIPEGMKVLHRCDNPPCVNEKHLFLGTQLDNIRDREMKGRGNTAVAQAVRLARIHAKKESDSGYVV